MVQVTIRTGEVQRLLGELSARGANLSPALRVVAMRLRSDTLRNFQQGGWFPGRWRASRRGGQTLVDTGTLRNSIHAQSSATEARAGTDLLYAAVHQMGATIRPVRARVLRFRADGRWISKREVTIPARPFLPVDDAGDLHPETQSFVADLFARYLVHGGAA